MNTREFAKTLQRGDIVALYGDLGAGKTTFVKAVAATLTPDTLVQSPTFTYLNIYDAEIPLFHFDLYRLQSEKKFVDMGFLDILHGGDGICFIEWPESIEAFLPENTKRITINHTENGGRELHATNC
ncbi:MAG: tRNA (adenosine(37)-N6)-threonylcarbamoyltransferase complex ATPase subunit type 1 TsaE [Simkaniaceae bacterium]|nr:tRNA (adenosine(37)-N6)-threonylcarbamoyltransferase complex ATPase subunit type 1 TsaE [Candidatus Sacchlamyda saccharinae]